MIRKLIIGAILALAAVSGAGQAQAVDTPGSQIIGPFGGLSTTLDPSTIPASNAQDLLNVDITPGGKSVKKREGLALDTTLTYSSSVVHGAYKFFDSNGSEVRLWGQDAGIYASVSGANYVRVATGTVGATWQCTDYLGFAYCVSSSRDTPVKTDGTTTGTSYQGTIPAGTMIASTPERLLVSGVSGQAQRIYYSGASNFTDFTVGVLTSSSSYEDVTAPGSAIKHIAYRCGRWLWWKDQSFGFLIGTNQTNLDLVTVSDYVGTFDNTDVYDSGITYFRGSDNQFYTYDCSTVKRFSEDIIPTANSANRRKSNSWTQTSQADFQAGSITPANQLSTTITVGDVTTSSFSVSASSAAYASKSVSNLTFSGTNILISTNAVEISNNDLETSGFSNWSNLSGWTQVGATASSNADCTVTPKSGSLQALASGAAGSDDLTLSIWDASSNLGLSTTTVAWAAGGCTFVERTISASGLARRMVKLHLAIGSPASALETDSFISNGADVLIWTATQRNGAVGIVHTAYVDLVHNTPKSDITSGYYVSQAFNTGFSSPSVTGTQGWTVNEYTPYFELQTSSYASAGFLKITGSSGTVAQANQYVRFVSSLNVTGTNDALTSVAYATIVSSQLFNTGFSSCTTQLQAAWTSAIGSTPTFTVKHSSWTSGTQVSVLTSTSTNAITNGYLLVSSSFTSSLDNTAQSSIDNLTVLARSSGTFRSAVKNAPSITSWNTLTETDTTVGASSITYYYRASNTSFNSTDVSTPVWVSMTKNSVPPSIVAQYFQARADYYITAATESASTSDFTFNWYEGNAADKMYGTYFNYGIWFSVSLGTTTSANNRILRYDLLSQAWTLYDIPSNGFLIYNNNLYIGDATVGKTYKFGGVNSDNSVAINSYWRSKPFFGSSPFADDELRTSSFYCKQSSGTTLSVTYTLNRSSSTTYSINLYDSRSAVIRHARNFVGGALANVFDLQFGDNSTNPGWEVFAGEVAYMSKPWSVYP